VFFFPFRPAIRIHRIPVITLLVSLVCLFIYYQQARNEERIEEAAVRFCSGIELMSRDDFSTRPEYMPNAESCAYSMLEIHASTRPLETLAREQEELRGKNRPGDAELLRDIYYRFAATAPRYLTAQLWYERPSWNLLRMFTSSISHGSWDHVIFNLIFFFAFGAAIELILGPLLFVAVILMSAVGIGVIDTLVHLGQPPIPSLGLSGVVTAMMAMFIFFNPAMKVRFFYWALLIVGTINVPGWVVGLFYIGGDMLRVLSGHVSQTNYIAHLGGAAMGFLIGMTMFRQKREWVRDLSEEVVENAAPENESIHNTIVRGLPGMTGTLATLISLGFVLLFGIAMIVHYITTYWVILLMVAPAAAVGWVWWSSGRERRPAHDRFQEAMRAIELGNPVSGMQRLTALAEEGYVRGQIALADCYLSGKGCVRDERKALAWLEAAAARMSPEALHRIAMFYLDGRGGVRKDVAKSQELLKAAVSRGNADSAMSLAHQHLNTVGTREQREQGKDEAVNWYLKAAEIYLRVRRYADARAALQAVQGIRPGHPPCVAMEARLAGLVKPSRPDDAQSPQ
jgi:membrane associated rhomboid family serine protease